MPRFIHPYFQRPTKKHIIIDVILLLAFFGVWALPAVLGFEWVLFALVMSVLFSVVFTCYAFKRQKDRNRRL